MHIVVRQTLYKYPLITPKNGSLLTLSAPSAVTKKSKFYSTESEPSETVGTVGREGTKLRFHHEYMHRPVQDRKFDKIQIRKSLSSTVLYLSLEERLKELDPKLYDPELHKRINIGFSVSKSDNPAEQKRRLRKVLLDLKNDKELQKLTKNLNWRINTEEVQREWLTDAGPSHISKLATHCGIFKDLYGPYAYFNSVIPLAVEYEFDEETVSSVFRGNILKPRETSTVPDVSYPAADNTLWTLKLTNPDGDLYKPDSECLHWLVTNIKGNDLSSGETLAPYVPPFPPKGVGYQRMVFVLYRQSQELEDMEQYRISDPHDMRQRSFSTESFYRKHEEVLTPCGLSWFNVDHDSSLTKFYHDVLGMKEPVYEYEFPGPFIREQEKYPRQGRDFAGYLDLYRTKEDIGEEMLLKKLSRSHPFKKHSRVPYPCTMPINHKLPSWRRLEIMKERLGTGKYKQLYEADKIYDTSAEEGLEDAAATEVDKKHMLRLGAEWSKVHLGIKSTKRLAEKAEEAAKEK